MNHYILHWSAALLLLCGSRVVTAQNNGLAVTDAELSGILSETLAELNLLQGAVIITDMDDNCVATVECRLAKHKSRPITRKFREAVESSCWRILKDTCEVDTMMMRDLDVVVRGETKRTATSKYYRHGALTAYYPAENSQYRIFIMVENDLRKFPHIPYARYVCAPFLRKIIEYLECFVDAQEQTYKIALGEIKIGDAVLLDTMTNHADYYTLEYSYNDKWVYGSTSRRHHANYGEVDSPDLELFVAWIFSSGKKLLHYTDINRNDNETVN